MERRDIIKILKNRGIVTSYIEKCLSTNDEYDKDGITIKKAFNYTI